MALPKSTRPPTAAQAGRGPGGGRRLGAGRVPLVRQAAEPVEAVFVERPHRFAAVCRLPDGREVEAHLPNPGRLTGTAAPGRPVLLDGPYPPPRKLAWTCVAMREPRAWVGTVTTAANLALPVLLEAGLLPALGRPEALRAEVARGRSRFDWVLTEADGGIRWVEVKSVTMAKGRRALFPDAVTARGARHLHELAEMARGGERCSIVFVAQRADVDSFEAARDIDPVFADALAAAEAAGVQVMGAALAVSRRGLTPKRRLAWRR